MKKTTLSLAMLTALGLSSQSQAVTLTFENSTSAGVQGVDFNYTCNTSNFTAGAEVRLCDANGALAGGAPAQKNTMLGGEAWFFNNDGSMTGVANTATTPGVSPSTAHYIDMGYVDPTADRDGGPGIDSGGTFFDNAFGFLAPFVGSEATTSGSPHPNDTAWGVAQYTETSATTFEVFFPVLEMQWAGTGSHFTLGSVGDGVTFFGTTDGVNFSMWAEELINVEEDAANCCFAGWSVEWYYTGTIATIVPSDVPLPASVWLFGSGLIALFSRYRRKRA